MNNFKIIKFDIINMNFVINATGISNKITPWNKKIKKANEVSRYKKSEYIMAWN